MTSPETILEWPIVVRPIEEPDVASVVEIEKLCFSYQAWNQEDLQKYDCFVASVGETVVGFLISRGLSFPPDPGHEFEILNIAVHPSWRRRGVARALLGWQLDRGGTQFLEVRESNVAARNLYESLGFQVVGIRRKYYSSPEESAIVMRRK
jgi:ribosomal-protein-alanine N-acetyltransferase